MKLNEGKIDYALYWVASAIQNEYERRKQTDFSLLLHFSSENTFEPSFEEKQQAIARLNEQPFISIVEAEEREVLLIGATEYLVVLKPGRFQAFFKESVVSWKSQMTRNIDAALSRMSVSTTQNIITVIDAIVSTYELNSVVAKPPQLNTLDIPQEKLLNGGISFDDLRFILTFLWQNGFTVIKKHLPRNVISFFPYPAFTFDEVMERFQELRATLQSKIPPAPSKDEQKDVDPAAQAFENRQRREAEQRAREEKQRVDRLYAAKEDELQYTVSLLIREVRLASTDNKIEVHLRDTGFQNNIIPGASSFKKLLQKLKQERIIEDYNVWNNTQFVISGPKYNKLQAYKVSLSDNHKQQAYAEIRRYIEIDSEGNFLFDGRGVTLNQDTDVYRAFRGMYEEYNPQTGIAAYKDIDAYMIKSGSSAVSAEKATKRIRGCLTNKQQNFFARAKINKTKLENKTPDGSAIINVKRGVGIKFNNPAMSAREKRE